MNHFLREDLRRELENVLSLDTDSELYNYQFKNEKKIGRVLGKGHIVGLSSGTEALQFSLTSLGIGKKDEVITVPNTNIATLLAISNIGANPVLVDISPDTMLIDMEKIESSITERTRAIIPVHLNGLMVDMEKIRKIAKKHNLYMVEDACQAHLARYNNKPPGKFSEAACYSFHVNKNLGGITTGGMIITKKRYISKKSKILRSAESNNSFLLKSLRTPSYLDWIQIAFILAKMRYIKQWTSRRREIAKIYTQELANTPLKLPYENKKAYHVYRDYVVRTKYRSKLVKYLKRKGIQTTIHYPLPLHITKTYRCLGYKKGDFPVAEENCENILSLPVNPFLREEEIYYVIKKIKSFFK